VYPKSPTKPVKSLKIINILFFIDYIINEHDASYSVHIFILYLDCTYRDRSINSHQEGGPGRGRRGLWVKNLDFSPRINCSAKCSKF